MKPNLRTGASYSMQLRYLYPRILKAEKFVNLNAKDKISELLAVNVDIKNKKGREEGYNVQASLL